MNPTCFLEPLTIGRDRTVLWQGNPFPFGEVGLGDAGEYIVSGFVGACPIENDTLNLLAYPFQKLPKSRPSGAKAPLVLSTTPLETVQYQWAGPDGFYPSADSIAEASVTSTTMAFTRSSSTTTGAFLRRRCSTWKSSRSKR